MGKDKITSEEKKQKIMARNGFIRDEITIGFLKFPSTGETQRA